MSYEVAQEVIDDVEIFVPDPVKWAYLLTLSETDIPDLTLPRYYETKLTSYSSWSFPIHKRQLEEVLRAIPLDTVVVAPADGIGVVASLWKGDVVAGDIAASSWTNKRVHREVMMETYRRSLVQFAGRKKVFILAYCQQFLEDFELAVFAGLPTVFVEANDKVTSRIYVREICPGVFATASYLSTVPLVNPEFVKPYLGHVLYTENLLQHVYVVLAPSQYTKYYEGMCPQKQMVMHKSFRGSPSLTMVRKKRQNNYRMLLVEGVRDLERFSGKYSIYFAPLGVTDPVIEDLPTVYAGVHLRCRQLYRVSEIFFKSFRGPSLYKDVVIDGVKTSYYLAINESSPGACVYEFGEDSPLCYTVGKITIPWSLHSQIVDRTEIRMSSWRTLEIKSRNGLSCTADLLCYFTADDLIARVRESLHYKEGPLDIRIRALFDGFMDDVSPLISLLGPPLSASRKGYAYEDSSGKVALYKSLREFLSYNSYKRSPCDGSDEYSAFMFNKSLGRFHGSE
jgi:hypothetical protein